MNYPIDINSDIQSLFSLGKELSINYYNVSLQKKNPLYLRGEELEENFKSNFERIDKIFKGYGHLTKNTFQKEFQFGRNILIVGAGASINACKELLTSEKIIYKLFFDTGFLNFLKGHKVDETEVNDVINNTSIHQMEKNSITGKIVKTVIKEMEDYLSEELNENNKLSQIIDKLQFEGCLWILNKFIGEIEVARSLQLVLGGNLRYIPNKFYEIVAHLFKHRFYDVIINLNFDELLDNSLEDEMGESEFIKIYNEESAIQFENSFIENRMIKPVYIKPHGTVSDVRSMKYTLQHYLSISKEIKQSIYELLSGSVGNNKNRENDRNIAKINISVVGYSMNDKDMKQLIGRVIKQLSTKIKTQPNTQLNFYVFESTLSDSEIAKKRNPTSATLKNYLKSYAENLSEEELQVKLFIEEVIKNIKTIYIEKEIESNEDKLSRNIDDLFKLMYYSIRSNFNKPFVPKGIIRHQLISKVFSRDLVARKYNLHLPDDVANYLVARVQFELVYSFILYNGKLPRNLLIKGRAGKYYQLYKQILQKNDKSHTIESLEKILKSGWHFTNKNLEEWSDSLYEFQNKKLYEDSFNLEDNGIRKETFNSFARSFINILKAINLNIKDELISEYNIELDEHNNTISVSLLSKKNIDLIMKLFYAPSFEINPNYSDLRFNFFDLFDHNQVVNTNLCLTWKFFEFAALKQGEWDHLDMITPNGNPVTNLSKYYTGKDDVDYLKRMKTSNKSIHLYQYIDAKKAVNVQEDHGLKPNLDYFQNAGYDKNEIIIIDSSSQNKKGVINLEIKPGSVHINKISAETLHYQIVLFSKIKKRNKEVFIEPVFGIYIFRPLNKNQINPIWFEKSESDVLFEANKTNLKRMYELFRKLINENRYNIQTKLAD